VPLIVYAVAAYSAFQAQHADPDYHGATEVFRNFAADRLKNIPETLELVPNLFLYTQPVSTLMLFAFHPAIWRAGNASGKWPESDRLLLRGLVGVSIVSVLVTLFWGLVHPRYSYVWLPMICPIVGAVAAGWERGVFRGVWGKNRIPEFAAAAAIFYGIGVIVIAGLCIKLHAPKSAGSIAAAAIAVPVTIGTVVALAKTCFRVAGWGFIALVLLAGVAFGSWGIGDRERRSTTAGSAELMRRFPMGTTLTTGGLIFQQPELFFYAGMNAESYPYQFENPIELPTSRWLILLPSEYANWSAAIPDRLKDYQQINKFPEVIMVWYVAKGDTSSATRAGQ
jgi:hypothetical protein